MNQDNSTLNYDPRVVLDSLGDGVYVVNRDRKIIFWGRSAQRITGWPADDILGKRCADDVLCHEDKDGRRLCGKEYCPLHRCMVTGQGSIAPIVLFARGKDGRRIPMRVSVAPIRNSSGEVIGGVETFRDLSGEMDDFLRAKRIQALSLQAELPEDSRVRFSAHYTPHDVVGGDYYAITQLDADRYGFLLADVCGHGVSAALYTMYLSSLWQNHSHLICSPGKFNEAMNSGFDILVKEDQPFATGIAGLIDVGQGELRLAGAGNPPPLLIRGIGQYQGMDCPGLPLGCFPDATYEETVVPIGPGHRLLLYTDGAIEVGNADGRQLGTDGLITVLKKLGYPGSGIGFELIEKAILEYSDRIRFDDDLTFLEVGVL
ncbi:MAG: PP2C family protein-serine/threonine phosphatase [Planctomycetota bacterium]|jgi:PAS domain S-box-containing protein